jgi:hypothetical protein
MLKTASRIESVAANGVPVGVEDIKVLKSLKRLTFLSLNDTGFNDEMAEQFMHQSIRTLSVADCPLTDRGAAALLALPRIEYLDMTRCGVTDRSIARLPAKLWFVGLSGTAISEQAVAAALESRNGGTYLLIEWGSGQKSESEWVA